jgi:hypothetical protein
VSVEIVIFICCLATPDSISLFVLYYYIEYFIFDYCDFVTNLASNFGFFVHIIFTLVFLCPPASVTYKTSIISSMGTMAIVHTVPQTHNK